MRKKGKQRFNDKLVVVILGTTSLLLGANMLVSNILATTGEQLENLTQREANLSQQNQRLRKQIISLSSLDTIEIRALELGLQKTNQVISLSSMPQVAMNQP